MESNSSLGICDQHKLKYSHKLNAVFPAKAYLDRYKDPKTDQTKSQSKILTAFHSFYEKHVSVDGRKPLSLLEYGGGPAVFSFISAAKYVESITFTEYAETNRDEVLFWKEEKAGCHDWSKFVEYVVKDLEGDTSEGVVQRREKLMREKIKDVIPCDAANPSLFSTDPLDCQYDIVQSKGCIEAVVGTREAYSEGIAKLASFVKPGGYLVVITGKHCQSYCFPGVDYSLYVLEVDTEDVLRGIEMSGMSLIETFDISRPGNLVSGVKSHQFTVAHKIQA